LRDLKEWVIRYVRKLKKPRVFKLSEKEHRANYFFDNGEYFHLHQGQPEN